MNLGIPHGVPGILLFLNCILKQYPEYSNRANKLLIKGSEFLISIRTDKNSVSLYNYFYPRDLNGSKATRLAWCYGDLCAGMALLYTGITTKNKRLVKISNDIFLHTTNRVSLKQSSIKDCGLCHGTSGLILMYFIAGRILKNQKLINTSFDWLAIGLNIKTEIKTYNDLDLLEGLVGEGLLLCWLLQNIKVQSDAQLWSLPAWKNILLL